MAIGFIPWRDIRAYAEDLTQNRHLRNLFIFVIRQMDAEYMTYQREKHERETGGQS